MRRARGHQRGRSGNAVLEFAIGWSLLWALFAGLYQFGYAMYIYNGLVNAATVGAAFASRADFNASDTTFSDQVKNMVVYGSPSGGASPLVPSLTTAQVSVTWKADASGVPQNVTVHIVNYRISALFATFLLSNKPSCTMRYLGTYMT